MIILPVHALKKYIDQSTYDDNLPFKDINKKVGRAIYTVNAEGVVTKGTCVVREYSNLNVTDATTPRILLQRATSVAGASKTSFDIIVISMLYSMLTNEVDELKYTIGFEKLKKRFQLYSNLLVEYVYDGMNFPCIFQYNEGSDNYDAILKVSDKLSFKYMSFAVSSPKINY